MDLEFDRARIILWFTEIVFAKSATLGPTNREKLVDRDEILYSDGLPGRLSDSLLNSSY